MTEITKEQLHRLAILDALEAAGVDNWEGYDFALEDIRKEQKRRETFESIVYDILEAASEYIEEPAGRGCGYGFGDKAYEKGIEILIERSGELK